MRDIENTRNDQATAKADESTPIASCSSAVALIDEGNALEEQEGLLRPWPRYDMLQSKLTRNARERT
jgi:hypothetical protein